MLRQMTRVTRRVKILQTHKFEILPEKATFGDGFDAERQKHNDRKVKLRKEFFDHDEKQNDESCIGPVGSGTA